MRWLALVCAALVAALIFLATVGGRGARPHAPPPLPSSDAHGMSGVRPDESVPAGSAPARARGAMPRVELSRNGVLVLDGRSVGLKDLGRGCGGRGCVVVVVDEYAPWSHVEWVLLALEAAGVPRVRFDLPDGAAEICFDSAYWKQDASRIVGGHTAGVIALGAEDLAATDLARTVADEASRIGRDAGLKPLGNIYPDKWQTFGVVARALRAFRDAGVDVEMGFDAPEPLPDSIPPPSEDLYPVPADLYPRCYCRPGSLPLDLPPAEMGERESGQEEDDRLIVNLDFNGNIAWKKGSLTLDGLAAVLDSAKDRYRLKMEQQGKSGVEKLADGSVLSKVYVLIRADRAAPARHVGWILHVLAEKGFYKVQFGVASGESAETDLCVGALDRKIQLFLPTDGQEGIVGADEPYVNVYVDRSTYGVGAAGALDAEGLRGPLKAAYERSRSEEGRKIVAAVHVAPDVSWGRVMTAADELARAGFEKVDFRGFAPPDEATRDMVPLPR